MEKRVILAFILSFIVLMVWSALFAPKPSKITKNPRKEKRVTPKESVSPEKERALSRLRHDFQKSLKNLKESKIKEKEILIDTPLYQAIISNIGGGIKSFKLKRYRKSVNPDSGLVELVKLKENRNRFLYFSFSNPDTGNEDTIVYKPAHDIKEIRLKNRNKSQKLVFEGYTDDNILIYQEYIFYPDKYTIDVNGYIVNNSTDPKKGYISAHISNIPTGKKRYYSFKGISALINNKYKRIKQKKLKKGDIRLSGNIGWIAYEDDYFFSAIIPMGNAKGALKGKLINNNIVQGEYIPTSTNLTPGEKRSFHFQLYLGPKDLKILKESGNRLHLAINFGWTDIIAKPLLLSLRFFNKYVNNYGISIIILTVLIKILFWPLTNKSYKSMKEMQKIQPLMAKIREKYKDNKEQLNRELMNLYKTYKVNPMGGCLPMIIQIPVFFALYKILAISIELRHAPFMLWINDLSAPDRLFNFSFKIPFMSPPYGIPVLTLLMGASMFVQQKMTPPASDPTQAKFMMFLPIIFTVMFINFPSGLVLYWLVNNILSIGQQYLILKQTKN